MLYLEKLFFALLICTACSHLSAQELDYNYRPSPWITSYEAIEDETQDFTDEALVATKSETKDNKVRKILREAIERRQSSFEAMIGEGQLIFQGDLYDYVQGVLDKILAVSGSEKAVVAIVRNESPNAFNSGNNIVFIHLGLLARLHSEEELAFVLAHEWAHNSEKHFQRSVEMYASLQTNDSINKRIRSIKSSQYGRVSAMNELMIPWILSNREDSREKEYDADELAYEWCRKAGYNVANAIQIFDVLGFGEHERDTVPYDLTSLLYLDEIDYDFSKSLNPSYGSSLGKFTVEKDTLEDLLRTHPFSKERKELYKKKAGVPTVPLFEVTNEYQNIRYMAEVDLMATLMYEGRVARATLYALSVLRSNPDHAMAREILPLSFLYIAKAKERRYSGKLIPVHNNKYDDVYNDLIYFLRKISPKASSEICQKLIVEFDIRDTSDAMNPIKAIALLEEEKIEDYKIRLASARRDPSRFYVVQILETIASK